MAQLIDVYIHLQHCDGVEKPPPLYINLYTTVRFSYRLEFLLNAIAEGKGLSHLRPSESAEDGGAQDLLDQSAERDGTVDSIALLNKSHTDERQGEGNSLGDNATSHDGTAHLSPNATSESVSGALSSNVRILPGDLHTANSNVDTEHSSGISAIVPTAGRNEQNMATKTAEPTKGTGKPSAEVDGFQTQKHHLADDGDFIDYEDDEELAHDSSTGSSTLQGDVGDSSSNILLLASEDKLALRQGEYQASEHVSEIASILSLGVSAAHTEQDNAEDEISYNAADDVEHENGQKLKADAEGDTDDSDKTILAPQGGSTEDRGSLKAIQALSNTNIVNSCHDSDGEYNAEQNSAESAGGSSYGDDEQENREDDVHTEYHQEDNQPTDVEENYAQEDDHQPPDDNNSALGDQSGGYADDVGEDDFPGNLTVASVVGDSPGGNALAETELEAMILGNTTDRLEDDVDEITYEDDEDNVKSPTLSNVEQTNGSSPGSLKRPRSDSKVGHATDGDPQGEYSTLNPRTPIERRFYSLGLRCQAHPLYMRLLSTLHLDFKRQI